MRYFLITFSRKPNGQIDEMIAVSKKVKKSDTTNCNVIMDFAEKKVLKSIIENKHHDTTFDKLRDYYVKIYPNLIEQLEKEASITKAQEKNESKLVIGKKKV